MGNKGSRVVGFLFLVIILMTGCELEIGGGHSKEYDEKEEYRLKVAHINASLFEERYGKLLEDEYPNITFDLIDEGLAKADPIEVWVQENKPDLIFIPSYEAYNSLHANGHLVELDELIARDEYDMEKYVQAAVELLKNNSRRKLFGLAPNFSSDALFYNKAIFEAQQLPYPSDNMSWSQVFELVDKLQTGMKANAEPFVPFENHFQTAADLFLEIGLTEGLSYMNEETGEVTLNTESWRDIWQGVISRYQTGAVENQTDQKFLPNHAAMYIGNYIDYRQLVNKKKQKEWGIARFPINPNEPDLSNRVELLMITSIAQESPNKEAAWEVIKYLNGDDVAKHEMNSPLDPGFSSIRNWNETWEDIQTSAFYHGLPDVTASEVPFTYRKVVVDIVNEHIGKVINNEVALDQALDVIQEEAQGKMDQVLSVR